MSKSKKSKYLDKTVLAELAKSCEPFLPLRNQIYAKYGIDPLETDTLSSIAIYKIVSQYDPDYNVNFARNGEDGQSEGILIEQKATKVTKKKRSGEYIDAGFQFHAQGDIEYNRYIFAKRDKNTLDIVRIYDISNKENIELVQLYLLSERDAWEQKNRELGKTQKRDVIVLPENILIDELKNIDIKLIDGVEVVRA